MKNNQNKIIILTVLGFAIFLAGGYMFVTGIGLNVNAVEKKGEIAAIEEDLSSLIETYYQEMEVRIGGLVKKDLYGDVVGEDECGVVDGMAVVDVIQLLPKEDWTTFSLGNNGLVLQYPSEGWFVQTENSDKGEILTITTTQNGAIDESSPWAQITVGEYGRTAEESLLDWLKGSDVLEEGEEAPVSDTTIQYVMIGESMFLGSIFFKENIWVGEKSVYA
ncbi:MAG: hypothetical protein KAS07_00830, partial [Candidatus Pacebacteria bacterium]|nr:hypothetical protein [Candidatus Paceibacterota bacterium]